MGKTTYLVVTGENVNAKRAIDEVINGVQEYLDQGVGWEPTGGIGIVKEIGGYYHAYQAIIKK